MALPPQDFIALLAEAAEKRREEQARQEWLAIYPWMTEKTFIPFEQFYQRIKQVPSAATWRPAEDVFAEVRVIREAAAYKKLP